MQKKKTTNRKTEFESLSPIWEPEPCHLQSGIEQKHFEHNAFEELQCYMRIDPMYVLPLLRPLSIPNLKATELTAEGLVNIGLIGVEVTEAFQYSFFARSRNEFLLGLQFACNNEASGWRQRIRKYRTTFIKTAISCKLDGRAAMNDFDEYEAVLDTSGKAIENLITPWLIKMWTTENNSVAFAVDADSKAWLHNQAIQRDFLTRELKSRVKTMGYLHFFFDVDRDDGHPSGNDGGLNVAQRSTLELLEKHGSLTGPEICERLGGRNVQTFNKTVARVLKERGLIEPGSRGRGGYRLAKLSGGDLLANGANHTNGRRLA